jgi:hypothetical protein
MKNAILIAFLFLRSNIGFCQRIELSKTFYPLAIISQNDTPNPVLIRVDGSNSGLATMAVNSNNSTGTPAFVIGRNGSNWGICSYNQSLNTLDMRVAAQSFMTIRVNPTNNFVTINAANAPTIAQLDVNGTIKLGVNGTVLNKISKTTVILDFPTIAASQTSFMTFGVLNASIGSVVSISPDVALDSKLIIAYAYISQPHFVTVVITNISTTNAVDSPNMYFHATVIN